MPLELVLCRTPSPCPSRLGRGNDENPMNFLPLDGGGQVGVDFWDVKLVDAKTPFAGL